MPRKKEENRIDLIHFLKGKTIIGVEKSPASSRSDTTMRALSLVLDTGDKITISCNYQNITIAIQTRESLLDSITNVIDDLQRQLDNHWKEKKLLEDSIKKTTPKGIAKQL